MLARHHCLRDLTRDRLTSALNEIAEAAGVTIATNTVLPSKCPLAGALGQHISSIYQDMTNAKQYNESVIPVREDVQGACEILRLDPLYVANEGRFVAFVAPADGERALALMRADER